MGLFHLAQPAVLPLRNNLAILPLHIVNFVEDVDKGRHFYRLLSFFRLYLLIIIIIVR